jgi:anti-sigma B factor antagonist
VGELPGLIRAGPGKNFSVADSYQIDQQRTPAGDATIVRVSGELDINARDDLHDAIVGALDDGDVLVDLAAVDFIDSEALSTLIEGYNQAGERDAGFRVVNARGVVARVLAVSGAAELFGP